MLPKLSIIRSTGVSAHLRGLLAAAGVVAALSLGSAGCSTTVDSQFRPATTLTRWDDTEWATVLKNVVTPDGFVRYDVLRQNRDGTRDTLFRYVGKLSAASPENRPELFPTQADRLAYWINAYNAICLYRVVQRGYPGNMLASVPPGAIYFTDYTSVGGETYSLDRLEKTHVLSAGDPRVHCALNCASYSCPPLRSEPYAGAKLEQQLDDQTKNYLKDPRAVTVVDAETVGLNSIFTTYYSGDFTGWYQKKTGRKGSVLDALKLLAGPDSPVQKANDYKGTGYNWDRNDAAR